LPSARSFPAFGFFEAVMPPTLPEFRANSATFATPLTAANPFGVAPRTAMTRAAADSTTGRRWRFIATPVSA
jgi:hypothetical protein